MSAARHPLVDHLVDLESPYEAETERSYQPAELVRFALGVSDYWAGKALNWLDQGLSARGLERELSVTAEDRSRSQRTRHRASRLARSVSRHED